MIPSNDKCLSICMYLIKTQEISRWESRESTKESYNQSIVRRENYTQLEINYRLRVLNFKIADNSFGSTAFPSITATKYSLWLLFSAVCILPWHSCCPYPSLLSVSFLSLSFLHFQISAVNGSSFPCLFCFFYWLCCLTENTTLTWMYAKNMLQS